jgi:hypothetical protein
VQSTAKYLGVWFDSSKNMCARHLSAGINGIRYRLRGLQHLGLRQVDCQPLVMIEIYRALLRPALEYGMEAVDFSARSLEKLRGVESKTLKTLLGLSKFIGEEVVRGDLGLVSIKCRLARIKLNFFNHLCLMPEESWAKRVLTVIWKEKAKQGFYAEVQAVAKWARMSGMVGDLDGRLHREWMSVVRKFTALADVEDWKFMVEQRNDRNNYYGRTKAEWGAEAYVNGEWSAGIKQQMAFRGGECGFLADRSTQVLMSVNDSEVSNWCRYCDKRVAESQLHVMMECSFHNKERREILQTVVGVLNGWRSSDGYGFAQLDRKEQMYILLGRQVGLSDDMCEQLNQCVQKFLVEIMSRREVKSRTLVLLGQCQRSVFNYY